ncbi:MAG: hypothetical protein KGP28_02830 [Bdellovibrionales bacterium]|nr:hypothetical protein [Bdellovibrionales bacterium]
MSQSVSSLLSLLPGNSFVMGRGVTAKEVQVSHEDLCGFCERPGHQVRLTGGRGADAVFLLESDSFEDSKEEQLLSRICEAMKMDFERVGILVRSGGVSQESWNSCMPFQWNELNLLDPRVVIVLGDQLGRSILGDRESVSAHRGRIHDRFGLKVLITEDLSGMLQNPNLKKQAWEELKLALKIIKNL